MQPNEIALAIDLANNGTDTNVVYTRLEELVNRSTYGGPTHSYSSTDTVQFYRTNPVRSGPFLGAAKQSVKTTVTVMVPDAEGNDSPRPLIVETSFSIPVGTATAVILAARQKHVSLLDRDDIMDPLNNQGQI